MRTRSMRPCSLPAAALAALAALAAAPTARAQPSPDDAKRADALFTEGRELMAKGDAAAACPKFVESHRLDPGLGTLLNMALCHETIGKVGTALVEFQEAARLAHATGETKREATANEHIQALTARAPMLTLTIADPAPGQTLTIAGADVPAAAWRAPIAVDPGTVEIVVAAPERKPYTTTVTAAEGARQTVAVPALVRLHGDVAPPPSTKTVIVRTTSTRRYVGIGVGGAGVVGLGVSAFLGWTAKSRYDGAFDDGHCDRATKLCDGVGQNATEAARKRGNTATIVGGIGLAAVAAGVVLFVTAPHGEHATTSVVPTVGPDGAGVTWLGSF